MLKSDIPKCRRLGDNTIGSRDDEATDYWMTDDWATKLDYWEKIKRPLGDSGRPLWDWGQPSCSFAFGLHGTEG